MLPGDVFFFGACWSTWEIYELSIFPKQKKKKESWKAAFAAQVRIGQDMKETSYARDPNGSLSIVQLWPWDSWKMNT